MDCAILAVKGTIALAHSRRLGWARFDTQDTEVACEVQQVIEFGLFIASNADAELVSPVVAIVMQIDTVFIKTLVIALPRL